MFHFLCVIKITCSLSGPENHGENGLPCTKLSATNASALWCLPHGSETPPGVKDTTLFSELALVVKLGSCNLHIWYSWELLDEMKITKLTAINCQNRALDVWVDIHVDLERRQWRSRNLETWDQRHLCEQSQTHRNLGLHPGEVRGAWAKTLGSRPWYWIEKSQPFS